MPMNPKTKHGLIYARPGNCDRARTREEVAASEIKDSEGIKSGLSLQDPTDRIDEFGYPILGGML